MLYQAIHVPEGVERPVREVVYTPGLAHYVAGWGRAGDLGSLAVTVDGSLAGAAWLRLFPGDNTGYGFVDDVTPELARAVIPGLRGQGIGARATYSLLCLFHSRGRGSDHVLATTPEG